MGKMFFIDLTRCTACRGCQVACKQWHEHKAVPTKQTGTHQNPPDLTPFNFKVVRFSEHKLDGRVVWLFFPDQCRHCVNPPCKDAADAYVPGASFKVRLDALKTCVKGIPNVRVVPQVLVHNEEELRAFEEKCLAEGYEGAMVRSLEGPYKCGRSTVKEGYLLKVKRFEDGEAEILEVAARLARQGDADVEAPA